MLDRARSRTSRGGAWARGRPAPAHMCTRRVPTRLAVLSWLFSEELIFFWSKRSLCRRSQSKDPEALLEGPPYIADWRTEASIPNPQSKKIHYFLLFAEPKIR